ncbi:MAG TPA: LPS-assembly protein LptD [Burkholderiales bacterium]|nr:LPS-assembly protein LptD [Burkholderiales bacterium]
MSTRAQELGLKLKLQEELIPYSVGADEQTPLFLEADRLQGHEDKEIEAEGNVRLRKRGEAIFADYLRYSFPEDSVTARGNLRFEHQGSILRGEDLTYNLRDSTGLVNKADYFIIDVHGRGTADRIVAQSKTRLHVDNGTFTNCDVGNDDWYLRTDKLDLDRTRDVGTARDATVVFKGLPVLYTPYLDFSLSGARKSGFLPPSLGSSGQSGPEITQPYYWNIAPNADATISPRFMTRRGLLWGEEFRYLEPDMNGQLFGEYLPDDRVRQENRYAYSLQHHQNFGNGFTGNVDLEGVSDDFYFTDLADKISVTSITNLPRQGSLQYDGGWWTVNTLVQKFQTLQDPLAPVVPPYDREPQITLLANQQPASLLDLNFNGELVDFRHPSLIEGRRSTLNPSVSVPLQTSYFNFTPKVGYRYTHYTFDDDFTPPRTVAVPIYSLDSSMTFERDTKLFGQALTQTLEPRLYYVYIPFRQQDELPNFDTAVADFNLAQIFTENQFTGGDRINNANQLTAAVSSRFITPEDGAEKLRLTFGERYYFTPQLVSLNTNFPGAPPAAVITGGTPAANHSDLLAAISGSMARSWMTEVTTEYSTQDQRFERSNVSVQYLPDTGKVVNFAYRFTRGLLEQLDLSSQWPLSAKWSGIARWNYSLQDRQLLEGLAGVEYNAGCWGVRFALHRFVTFTQEYTNAVMLQFELSGLSQSGGSIQTLRQFIPGFVNTLQNRSVERNPFPVY